MYRCGNSGCYPGLSFYSRNKWLVQQHKFYTYIQQYNEYNYIDVPIIFNTSILKS